MTREEKQDIHDALDALAGVFDLIHLGFMACGGLDKEGGAAMNRLLELIHDEAEEVKHSLRRSDNEVAA